MDAPVKTVAPGDLPGLVGTEIGVSDWVIVDQARIDAFADVTDDHQFIHVDPEKAKATPFGGTIAHGFLTLSLLSRMAYQVSPALEGAVAALNYGFDKIRFLEPVKSGARVRGRFTLDGADDKGGGRWLLRYGVTVEIENEPKPALVAEWLGMQILKQGV